MPTSAQGGFGLQLKLNSTIVLQVDDVDELVFAKIMAEATGHDSEGGYYESVAAGKRRVEPFSIGLFWDNSLSIHAAVIAAFDSDDFQQLSWIDPDSDEQIQFKAHIESIGRISAQEDAYKANVLIHPTGTVNIA